VRWHSSLELTPDRLRAFEGKALAILNEHLLAIRLRALGCRLIDVNWLHGRLKHGALEPEDLGMPWRRQLRGRLEDSLQIS
jgi:hypothetical protein